MEVRLLLDPASELPFALNAVFTLLLTYWSHAALWALAAAVLARGVARSASVRNRCWKVALFAPLLSAPLSSAFPAGIERALAGRCLVRELRLSAVRTAPRESAVPSAASERDFLEREAGIDANTASPAASLARLLRGQLGIACAILLLSSGCFRFAISACLLRTRLRSRQRVRDPRLLDRFEALRLRLALPPIALSESPRVGSPLLVGNSEICLPTGLSAGLTEPELDCVFAHELAHIERRDGRWFPLAGFVQMVLWFQPLTRWIAAEFRRSAEFACDDRAVELTSDALGLARALVRVASETAAARSVSLFPAMARSRSALLLRVRRLTEAQRDVSTPDRARRWVTFSLVATGTIVVSTSVQLAQASVRAVPAASRVRAAIPTPHSLTPDLVAQSERMDALARQARELEVELAAIEIGTDAERSGSAAAVRVLELNQALDHVHATQAWLEQQFVSEWAARDRAEHEH